MAGKRVHAMKRSMTRLLAVACLAMSAGCATRLTVDDGRALDSQLLSDMRAYGAAARVLRPAIVRSAELGDAGCSNQYELPFEAMTSYGVDDDNTRVAWLRTLGVNENLTVIAADPSAGLRAGDVVAGIDGHASRNKQKMAEALIEARDRGEPFALQLASGREVRVSPVKVCRGHVQVAAPLEPATQRYHWQETVHSREVFGRALTAEEAQWIVLWTQGLSEQGGARMKTYAFVLGGVKWIAVLALGLGTSHAASAARGATAAGVSSAGPVAAVQLAGQAASFMAQSAANRASLSGVRRVAAGMFDRADQWAVDHMRDLGMDPGAALRLHEKLVAQGAAANAFLFDSQRLAQVRALVSRPGPEAQAHTAP
jgi:hypothetical protein